MDRKKYAHMKTSLLKILVLMLLIPSSAFAQQTAAGQDSLLERMVGKWVLNGTIEGKETTHDVVTEWVLDHQYLQIKEVSREISGNGKPVYDAIVFISRNQKLNQYSCLWLDNTGNGGLSGQAIGHAKANGEKLEFVFKYSETSIFHTTFVYNFQEDSWQWFMDDEENGKLQPFARLKLTRK